MTITDEHRRRYLEAVARPDRRAALRLVDELLAGDASRQEVLLELMVPTQLEVGSRWQRGEWSVAQEHAATAISDAVVAAMMALDTTDTPRGHVVLACVERELHALPARIAAEVLQLAGWQVTYLGATTPPTRLAQYLHELGPDAVALSCTVSTSLPHARAMIEAARQAAVPVVVGGAGFGRTDERAHRLGADAWAGSAGDLTAVLERLPATTTPAPPHDHDGLDDHAELLGRRAEIVAAAYDRLVERFPALRDYDEAQTRHTLDDLGHLVDFAAVARYVPDDAILFDVVDWLADLLSSRGVPVASLVMGLDALADVVADRDAAAAAFRAASRRLQSTHSARA